MIMETAPEEKMCRICTAGFENGKGAPFHDMRGGWTVERTGNRFPLGLPEGMLFTSIVIFSLYDPFQNY
jgi:hypothetical protein